MSTFYRDIEDSFQDLILLVGFGVNKVCYATIQEKDVSVDKVLQTFIGKSVEEFEVPQQYYQHSKEETSTVNWIFVEQMQIGIRSFLCFD